MGVELVGDEYPFVIWRCLHCLRDVGHEVFFCPSRSDARRDLFAGGDFKVRYQALSPVALVFVFLSFDTACLTGYARSHWLGRRGALKRLNTDLLVRADKVNALRV